MNRLILPILVLMALSCHSSKSKEIPTWEKGKNVIVRGQTHGQWNSTRDTFTIWLGKDGSVQIGDVVVKRLDIVSAGRTDTVTDAVILPWHAPAVIVTHLHDHSR